MRHILLALLFLINGFPAESNQLNQSINCQTLESIKELKLWNNCKSLTIKKEKRFDENEYKLPYILSDEDVNLDVEYLTIEDNGWNRNDLVKISRNFPNIRSVTCNDCNIYELKEFNLFSNSKNLSLEYSKIPDIKPKSPYFLISFDGLNYKKIESINITTNDTTNITCRDLGIWGSKIYSSRGANNSNPYRDTQSCYPNMAELGTHISRGNTHYKNGSINSAHKEFLNAFNINPYNRKVLSNLSLTFYKHNEFCKSAEVALFGISLLPEPLKEDSSIWYNLHLSLKKLSQENLSIIARENSISVKNEISPNTKDFFNFSCSDSVWIKDHIEKIEDLAKRKSKSLEIKSHFVSFKTNSGEEYMPRMRNAGDNDDSGAWDWVEFEYKKGLDGQCRCMAFQYTLIELPSDIIPEETYLIFKYFGSNPLNLKTHKYHNSPKTFQMPDVGDYRIWVKNSDKKRNPKAIEDGGDYVTPLKKHPITSLNYNPFDNTVKVYVETIDHRFKSTPIYKKNQIDFSLITED